MKRLITSITLLGLISTTFGQQTMQITDSLLILLKSTKNDTHRVDLLNMTAGYFVVSDNYDSAMIMANEALLLSEQLGYQAGKASSLRKQGVARIQTGEYARGLENLLGSLRINEILGNKEEIFKLQNNIGNLYYSQGNYESALLWFMKAYAQKKEDGLTNANIGNTYLSKKDLISARIYLKRALEIYSSKNDQNGVSDMLSNLGTIHENKNELDSALKYYEQSLKIKKEIQDLQGQADIMGGIGDVKMKQKKYVEAIEYQNESVSIAMEIGYLVSAQESEKRLYELFEITRDTIKAYLHYKKHIFIRDQIYNELQIKQVTKAEMNFDFAKKQAIEEAIHSEELKHQKNQRNIFIVGFALILLFSVFLFRTFKKTQRQKRIIEEQKRIVEEHQKDVSDNLDYAAKLQRSMLPSQEYINQSFPENMVTFFPRDTVSGDFFYNYRDERGIYFGVADATGHGISASLTASLINSLLNEIIVERKIESPEMILDALKVETIKGLNQIGSNEERKDGADISLCRIINMKLTCACANNPIYIIRDKNLIEIKGDKFPIGKHIVDLPFTLKTFDLQKGDLIFSFSDGLSDQFGGPKNKKLMSKNFKNWLIELSPLEMTQIKMELECRFNNWKGSKGHQTDDVTIFGVRI